MAEKELERQNTIRKRELEQQKASMLMAAENEEKSKSLKSNKAPQPPGMDVASIESATMSEASDDDDGDQDQEGNADQEVEAINSGPDQQQQQNQQLPVEQEGSSVIESEQSTQPGSNEPKSILRKKSKYEQNDINGEPTPRRVAELRNGSVASMALPGEFQK